MSNINDEFQSISKDIEAKITEASKLLAEASKLSTANNLAVDKSYIDNLFNLVSELNPIDWDSSEYVDDGWSSSSYSC